MSKGVKVLDVNAETLQVTCEIGESTFIAEPFRWGGKMLMKVTTLGEGQTLDRGTRIAIGQKAKGAIKAAALSLPVAELKRPRKPKSPETVTQIPGDEVTPTSDVTPTTPTAPQVTIDYGSLPVDTLRALCKNRGIKGYHRDGVKKADLIELLRGAAAAV